MTTNTFGIFGQQESAHVPARARSVLVNNANAFPLGSVKKGQRCELMIRAVPGSPSAAVARINAGVAGNCKWSTLGEGGRILTEISPLEIYDPEHGVVVAVQKYDGGGGSNFNAYLYPVDGSNEPDRVPPLLVDQQQNRMVGVTGITVNTYSGPPTPAVANDLLLAWVASPLGATPLPIGAGWTSLGVIKPGADPTVSLWYKLAVGGELNETWQDLAWPVGTWAATLHVFHVVGASTIDNYGLKYPQTILGYNGVTSPLTYALWTGQTAQMTADTRFPTVISPALQVACFANFNTPYPGVGDIFLAAFPHSLEDAIAHGGGGDAVANATMCAGAVIVTDPANIQWHGINIDPMMAGPSNVFPFQAGTITLAPM